MKNKSIKTVLSIDLDVKGIEEDSISLYEELIISDDLDEDLDRSHVMYSFCVILGGEFEHKANVLEAKLEKWAGEKWRKLKASVKHRYTDNDAKRKIESNPYHLKQKILISKYRKLSKQLIFGGGKPLDMKARNIHGKLHRRHKALEEDFAVRDKRVARKVKSKLKRREPK